MSAETQTGSGTLHGITNSGSAITITGYATFLLQSVKGSHNFQLGEVKDAIGFDATLLASNEYIETTLDFVLSGATRAAAAATAVMPAPIAKLTLANFKVALFNGDWVYVGGTVIDLSNIDRAKLNGLKMRKYADAAQNTALTTTVTG